MTAKNELQSIISRLHSREWLQFERFLSSPYHNSDERLVRFCQLIRQHQFQVRPTLMYPELFANSPFEKRKWNDLQRKLVLALREFLLQEELRRNPPLGGLAAVNSRSTRQLYTLADETIAAYQALLHDHQLSPWEYATEQRRLYQKRYESYAEAPAIQHAIQAQRWHHIQYCLLELRFSIEILLAGTQATMTTNDLDVATTALIVRSESLAATYPLLAFYLLIYRTLAAGTFTEAEVQASEQAYYEWYEQLHLEDQSFFFVKLSTILNRGMRQRHPQARERYFALQQFGFTEGIFLRLGTMHLHTFLNICMIGTALGALDWVERFRQAHLPHLAAQDQPKAHLLSAAHLAFGRGEYAEVYKLAGQVNRLPKLLRLQFYGLQIKALTERYLQNEIYDSLLTNYLRSAKAFVRYHAGLQDNYQAPTLAMINLLQKLVQLRERPVPRGQMRAELRALWQASPNINAGEWLREKIEQL